MPRSATSCEASRSRYRKTPREIPNARTPTTATDSVRTGGICEARAMSHAAAAARPTALPSESVPSTTAHTTRRQRTSSSPTARHSGSAATRARGPVTGRSPRGSWRWGADRHGGVDGIGRGVVGARRGRVERSGADLDDVVVRGAHERGAVRDHDDGAPLVAERAHGVEHDLLARASRCAVGSSSTTSGTRAGSPSSAAASATRWRWPTLSPTPPRPTSVSQPAGSVSSTVSRPAVRAARSRSASVTSRPPATTSRSRPGASTGRWGATRPGASTSRGRRRPGRAGRRPAR